MREQRGLEDRTSSPPPDRTYERVGDLLVAQPREGYRYGIDPFLLFGFTLPARGEHVADLGTGCGILALLLALREPSLRVWGVELQSDLAGLAQENVRLNGLQERCTVINGDVRRIGDLLGGRSFHRVVSNPPFRPPATGKVCPHPQRAVARHELALTMEDVVVAASLLLRHGGLFDMIHLPERIPALFLALQSHGLEPKDLRLVHPFAGSRPTMALVSSRRGGRPGLKVAAPLVIFRSPGEYTEEVLASFPSRCDSDGPISSETR